jgi:pimeloyl-ACP methyl ester carboxylesterase
MASPEEAGTQVEHKRFERGEGWLDIVLATRGLIASDSHADLGDPDSTEWTSVDGVGSVFRRRDGPALLVSPMPPSPEMRRVMPLLWTIDARGWLSAVRTPTLVLCGSSDPVLPVSHAVALLERTLHRRGPVGRHPLAQTRGLDHVHARAKAEGHEAGLLFVVKLDAQGYPSSGI